MDIMLKDKIISLQNKTHIGSIELKEHLKFIKKELGLDIREGLKLMINWAIDKKFELEYYRELRDGGPVNKIKNLGDLVNGEKVSRERGSNMALYL